MNSFPSGSTAEPDDLKPMHIKSLLGCGTDGTGEAPKSAIIALVNMVLRGKIPIVVFASSFGVSLCVLLLRKKASEIRPSSRCQHEASSKDGKCVCEAAVLI